MLNSVFGVWMAVLALKGYLAYHFASFQQVLFFCMGRELSSDVQEAGSPSCDFQSTGPAVQCQGLRIGCCCHSKVPGITWAILVVLRSLQGCTRRCLRGYVGLGTEPEQAASQASALLPPGPCSLQLVPRLVRMVLGADTYCEQGLSSLSPHCPCIV